MTAAPRPDAPFPPFRVPSAAAIVAIAAVVAACVLLFLVAEALPVFVIGMLVAYILDPLVTRLEARRVPRGLGTLLAMVLAAVLVGAFAFLFLGTLAEQAAAFLIGLPDAFAQLEGWIVSLGLPTAIQEDILRLVQSMETAVADVDITVLFQPILSGVVALLGSFFTLITLPFFLFFLLAGRPALGRQVREVLPPRWRDDVLTVMGITLNSFGTYIRAEAIVAAILGVMTFIGINLLSIFEPRFAEFALLLAVIAAVSEFIPNFGPWIAAIPAVIIAMTFSVEAVVATIVLYMILMFTEGQILVPKIEGGAFSFHPALVLFLVVAGVALMGILGAVLALPVTAAAWRSVRYVFRRASGRDHDDALNWSGDPAKAIVLDAPVPPRPVAPDDAAPGDVADANGAAGSSVAGSSTAR